MVINVLDEEVVKNYKDNLKQGKDGIMLQVYNSENSELYNGVVWPNEQYEYDAEKGGEYKICVAMTESMFMDGKYKQIKTQVRFASEFHRDKKAKKQGDEEVHHAEKQQKEEESSLKQGHFAPIRRRINKIYKKILDIK